MKRVILFLSFIITSISSFSQSTSDEYLAKSRHQKTIAWVMLGGGVGLTALGVAVSEANAIGYAMGNSSNNNTAGTVLAVVGVASALGSIPMFISASKTKHKAYMSFNMQKVPMVPYIACRTAVFQPALKLSIAL
jgi:hypothetical protein